MSRTGRNEPVEHHDETDRGNLVLLSDFDPPDQQVARSESRTLLQAALSRLSEACQQLLRLRFFHDLTYDEIAARLGKKANSVNVQVLRCIAHLKNAYAQLDSKGQKA